MFGGMGRGTRMTLAAIAVGALGFTSACSSSTEGMAQTEGQVAGLPVTHFESGLKEDAPTPDLKVQDLTNSAEDKLAVASIADVSDYWSKTLPESFDGERFEPVRKLLSYDPEGPPLEVCGSTTKEAAMNAFFCQTEDLVAWDRGQLLPFLKQRFGPMAVVTVLGHEFGHAIQHRLQDKAGITKQTRTIVKEQQADCFTGSYFRWMAEGNSKYFSVSTSTGLNEVMASMYFIRDQAGKSANEKGAHGSAFDRTFAFQTGFEKGAKDCASMNQENIDARITEVPFDGGDTDEGDAKINSSLLAQLQTSLDGAFSGAGAQGPKIKEGDGSCPDGKSTEPASYCAGDNTVNVDLAKLKELGRPADRDAETQGGEQESIGDFAALAEIVSRYTQGVQKGVGANLENGNAGLRTSCLVGAWAGTTTQEGANLRLSPGDLDEAIAELLQPRSLIAADGNGVPVPSGFARVESLRKGFLDGSTACSEQYG